MSKRFNVQQVLDIIFSAEPLEDVSDFEQEDVSEEEDADEYNSDHRATHSEKDECEDGDEIEEKEEETDDDDEDDDEDNDDQGREIQQLEDRRERDEQVEKVKFSAIPRVPRVTRGRVLEIDKEGPKNAPRGLALDPPGKRRGRVLESGNQERVDRQECYKRARSAAAAAAAAAAVAADDVDNDNNDEGTAERDDSDYERRGSRDQRPHNDSNNDESDDERGGSRDERRDPRVSRTQKTPSVSRKGGRSHVARPEKTPSPSSERTKDPRVDADKESARGRKYERRGSRDEQRDRRVVRKKKTPSVSGRGERSRRVEKTLSASSEQAEEHGGARRARGTFFWSKDRKIKWSSVPYEKRDSMSTARVSTSSSNNRATPPPAPAMAAGSASVLDSEATASSAVGPTQLAISAVRDVLSTFLLFITPEVERVIVTETNREGLRRYGQEDWKGMDETDLRAYIGLLILAGVYRSRGEAAESLWDAECGRPIFRATMSLKTFYSYSSLLRFDNRATRAERRAEDKLAAIREVWDLWSAQLPLLYNPGADVTVDEQLIPFRGVNEIKLIN